MAYYFSDVFHARYLITALLAAIHIFFSYSYIGQSKCNKLEIETIDEIDIYIYNFSFLSEIIQIGANYIL